MAKTKYGIKVPVAVDDYIWVTEASTRKDFELKPVLYNSFNEAKSAAKIWGPLAKVETFEVDNP